MSKEKQSNKYIRTEKECKNMDDILKILGLFVFSIFAGTVRYLNREIHKISIKELILNGVTALLSGMLVYFLTAENTFFLTKPLFHAGIVGLSGYMAPETLNLLQSKYFKTIKGK